VQKFDKQAHAVHKSNDPNLSENEDLKRKNIFLKRKGKMFFKTEEQFHFPK